MNEYVIASVRVATYIIEFNFEMEQILQQNQNLQN